MGDRNGCRVLRVLVVALVLRVGHRAGLVKKLFCICTLLATRIQRRLYAFALLNTETSTIIYSSPSTTA